MNKIQLVTALAFILGAGAASAQQVDIIQPPVPTTPDAARQQASTRSNQASAANTGDALSRNMGPSSSVVGYNDDDPMGSAVSGLPHNPLAPGAGNHGGGGR